MFQLSELHLHHGPLLSYLDIASRSYGNRVTPMRESVDFTNMHTLWSAVTDSSGVGVWKGRGRELASVGSIFAPCPFYLIPSPFQRRHEEDYSQTWTGFWLIGETIYKGNHIFLTHSITEVSSGYIWWTSSTLLDYLEAKWVVNSRHIIYMKVTDVMGYSLHVKTVFQVLHMTNKFRFSLPLHLKFILFLCHNQGNTGINKEVG